MNGARYVEAVLMVALLVSSFYELKSSIQCSKMVWLNAKSKFTPIITFQGPALKTLS
jgi:hypothetical protein